MSSNRKTPPAGLVLDHLPMINIQYLNHKPYLHPTHNPLYILYLLRILATFFSVIWLTGLFFLNIPFPSID